MQGLVNIVSRKERLSGRLVSPGSGAPGLEPRGLTVRALDGGADGGPGATEEPVPVVNGVLVLRHTLPVQAHLNKNFS